jgi:molybdate transport system substrate-binding protein
LTYSYGVLPTACLALLLAVLAPSPPQPVLVSAAISLTDALQEIERAYAAAGGGPVRFNFAASNVLARQIANGAPVDLFISADLVQMQYAERAGAIAPGSSIHLLTNRLAVVTPPGRPLPGSDARALAEGSIKRIAIGDPAAVPAGLYARQYLERTGLWPHLQRKLLPLSSVRAALGAVESGGADAAIVYESDAAASGKVAMAFVVPAGEGPPIVYPAAIVRRSRNREAAERFLAFLRGRQAREIFTRFKFIPYLGIG